MYLMWFDDSARKPTELKIEEAVAAYVKHFKARPNVVLVNSAEVINLPSVRVRSTDYVRPHNFWVGREEVFAV